MIHNAKQTDEQFTENITVAVQTVQTPYHQIYLVLVVYHTIYCH